MTNHFKNLLRFIGFIISLIPLGIRMSPLTILISISLSWITLALVDLIKEDGKGEDSE